MCFGGDKGDTRDDLAPKLSQFDEKPAKKQKPIKHHHKNKGQNRGASYAFSGGFLAAPAPGTTGHYGAVGGGHGGGCGGGGGGGCGGGGGG